MKKYITILAVIFATGATSCKKGYLDQEVNPNEPSVSTPSLTLSAAEVGSAAIVNGVDYLFYGVWAGYWTASGNYVPNQVLSQYQFINSTFNADWGDLYSNLTNYNTLQKISTGPANANFSAIATIMEAYDFEELVDNFNDVPYSQAFQPSTILFPAYDKGEDIYHDLGKRLDGAIALIKANSSAINPGTADVVFGGNMTGWIKFANTLKLRLAIHVYKKLGMTDPLVTDLASTASDGYLDGSLDAEVNPGYSNQLSGSGTDQANPFWSGFGFDVNGNQVPGNAELRANAFAVKMMQNNNDPRVMQFYSPISSAAPAVVIRGNVFGDTKSTLLTNTSTSAFGPGLLQSPTQNAVLLSGAESLFLQAEAVNSGLPGVTGDAKTLYNAGITASFVAVQAGGTYTYSPPTYSIQTAPFVYNPVAAPNVASPTSAALAVTYYNQQLPNVNWDSSPNKELAIITQKWTALNGYFNLEAYNEYRRTGYPNLPSSIDPAAISQTLPTRILYPLTELTSNTAQLAKEGVINPFTSKIFWAQ